MNRKRMLTVSTFTAVLAFVGGIAISAQDKYTLKVPGGLSFSEFKGYESWQVVSISQDGPLMAATLANPEMIGTRKRWRHSPQRQCQALSMTWTSW
jgi:hypothetical protein